jgi:hypothetical protein
MTYIDQIAEMRACPDAVAWLRAAQHPTLAEAWAVCERGDWMLWLAARGEPVRSSAPWSDERKPLVRAAVACARLALPTYEARYPGDARVRVCLDTTEAWCRGEATPEEVTEARRGATTFSVLAALALAATDSALAAATDSAFAAIAAAAFAAFATIAAAAFATIAAANAADAADDATTAADAADAAADAADAAADAASYAASYAAAEYARVLRQCADLVRQHIPCPVLPEGPR